MANQININSNSNKVNLEDVNSKIVVRDDNKNTNVNVESQTTKVVQVNSPGPRGAAGPPGPSGSIGPAGPSGSTFPYSGSDDQFGTPPQAIITGSLLLSGSGHISSSGDISASGNLIGNQLIIGGGTFTSSSLAGGVGFPYSGSDDQFGTPPQAIITGSLLLSGSGHITASGNISSSGTITANTLEVAESLNHLDDANTGLFFAADTIVLKGNNQNIATFATNRIELNNNVTASGNITASGRINGATITSSLGVMINIPRPLQVSQNPFLISFDNDNGEKVKFSVSSSGVVRFGAANSLPTPVTGGLIYSGSNFYMGV
tara:strand:+ start:820 stop:1773 length:954 start_codon:yes stop_codon:yes gene_type:complete